MRRAGIVGLALVLGGCGAPSSHIDKAIDRLGDDDRFTTSAQAARTIAEISDDLRADGTKCGHGPKCAALLSAAAFTAVTATTLLDCLPADAAGARVVLTRYLKSVRDFAGTGAAPRQPGVITC
jgi:hypothetical protein